VSASTPHGNAGGASGAHTGGLASFRRRLDELDDQIACLLGERFQICRDIAAHKHEHEIPMMQPDRVAQVRGRYLARGAEAALPSDFTEELFELLIAATCRMEDELIEAAHALGGCISGDDGVSTGMEPDEQP